MRKDQKSKKKDNFREGQVIRLEEVIRRKDQKTTEIAYSRSL